MTKQFKFVVATMWPVAVTMCLVGLEPGLDHYRRAGSSYGAQCASEQCWASARESINTESRNSAWILVLLGPIAFSLPFMGPAISGSAAIVGCLALVSMINAGVFLVTNRTLRTTLITVGLLLWFSAGCIVTVAGT